MVEIRKVPEAAIRRPSPVSQKNVKMGMESEKLSKCLDEADSSRLDFIRAHCREQIETQRTPTTTCKLAKKLAIVAEVDAQALGYCKHHLPMGHLLEKLFGSKVGPDELALLVAARA